MHINLPDEIATLQFGQDLAMAIPCGGVVYLNGELGAGKSCLARALIRHMLANVEAEVPSPTFSLVQEYEIFGDGPARQIHHIDLYRISDPLEVSELDVEANSDRLLLIEWPKMGYGQLPPPDLKIEFEATDDDQRILNISGSPTWMRAIERSLAIRAFLNRCWAEDAHRTRLQGDASARSYELVQSDGEIRILMNAPAHPDGPIIKDGKPYSRIAHLAEDVGAFVGVTNILHQAGLRVPQIYCEDIEAGLLLLENLGTGKIVDVAGKPIRERYLACAKMLAHFHNKNPGRDVRLSSGKTHHIETYDHDALKIELELLTDWYVPHARGAALNEEERNRFDALWDRLIQTVATFEKAVILRDFHSPNNIWLGGESASPVAVIDYQDAVYGPSSYDLASLGQDARVDVSASLEAEIIGSYINERQKLGDFDEETFRASYAIMAAQRATKILGIFVRLKERDHKPGYLRHLPRLLGYMERNLQHPILAEYRKWFEDVINA